MRYSFLTFVVIIIFAFNSHIASLYAQDNDLPQFPGWMVKKRMDALNYQTPIQLDYNNNVQAYIDVYTVKRREHLSNIISRSKLYFPIFEEYLDKYDLPLELKYLAVIESALDPRAKSKSGAKGLWQFLYHAGKMFDLEVTTYIDERSDPVLATEAACKYLQYLYRNFNDWHLALAAYNGGVGVVKNAIERSGGITNYWELRPYLPDEVKGYVPAFIAATYVMNYFSNYDIIEKPGRFSFSQLDTVFVQQPISFLQISDVTGISTDDLSFLNPIFTKETIPVNDTPARIFLPKQYIESFVKNEPQLYRYKSPTPPNDTEMEKVVHVVEKGEYFHKIAIIYNCTVEEIVEWNHLKSKNLHPGQELIVYKNKDFSPYFFIRDEVNYLADK